MVMGKTNVRKWAHLRISVELLAKLRSHCEALGEKMSIFVSEMIERELNSSKERKD